jgi:hypothetical protein
MLTIPEVKPITLHVTKLGNIDVISIPTENTAFWDPCSVYLKL